MLLRKISAYLKEIRGVRLFLPILNKIFDLGKTVFCWFLFYPYLIRHHISSKRNYERLHVGCGKNYFKNWLNADIEPRADLIIFLQKRLPFKDNYLARIYSEHVLEHLTYANAVYFLKEVRRTLQPGGVLRIAMPDLDDLIDGYQQNWRRFDWVNWPAFSFIQTKAEMINIAFRWWGHKHLYNKEELARALSEAGFSRFYFPLPGQSDYPDLQGLETRKDSKLIAEAIKE
jgi:predicted SAM-dependent methyltransferase